MRQKENIDASNIKRRYGQRKKVLTLKEKEIYTIYGNVEYFNQN